MHAMTTTYEARGLARRTPWGHRAQCVCGWTQPGLAGTKKDALRAYYTHREEAARAETFECNSCGEFFSPASGSVPAPVEGRVLYLAYGMNLAPSAMGYFGCAHPVGAATLHGWRLSLRGYMDVQPVEGEAVAGGLWEIDERGLEGLDGREGYRPEGGFYDRRTVEVEVADGTTVEALVYFMRRPYPESPNPSYVDLVREGYRFFGLPEDLLDAVDARARAAFEGRPRDAWEDEDEDDEDDYDPFDD